jgi:hypothetical protein
VWVSVLLKKNGHFVLIVFSHKFNIKAKGRVIAAAYLIKLHAMKTYEGVEV